MKSAKDILIEQRDKLKADCEFLGRQVPFLAQRLEDMKQTLADNIDSIRSIESALEIIGVPAFPVIQEAGQIGQWDYKAGVVFSEQTSGPQCKKCGAFTTYARRDSHGLCMKCENELKTDGCKFHQS